MIAMLFILCVVLGTISAFFWWSTVAFLSVRFDNPDGSSSREFKLKVASTGGQRQKGLMFRKRLDPYQGVLFVFPTEREHSFWMKDTYISVDMVFLDSAFRVVGVLSDVPILSLDRRTIGSPSMYVIELLAGSARENRIQIGSVANPQQPFKKGLRQDADFSPSVIAAWEKNLPWKRGSKVQKNIYRGREFVRAEDRVTYKAKGIKQ